jgi:hypothetical protein
LHYIEIYDLNLENCLGNLIYGLLKICAEMQNFSQYVRRRNAETCTMDDEKFKIRVYGFGELAQLYLPDATPMSASNRLRFWITRNSSLMDKLQSIGYAKGVKLLTPEMVREIVGVIGEP